jgi:isoleucyl-tRNA synthetase
MSKSLGNTIAPQDIVKEYWSDILRLWVVSTDYTNDQRIGPEIVKQTADGYRRLRNTLRFLLGALDGFTEAERVSDVAAMPELERFVLHRLSEMDRMVRQSCHDFEFHTLFAEITQFCTVELSAFYFDIRKDVLYCDAPDSARRMACRTVLDHLYHCLVKWMAPFLCFTAEEAWLARHPDDADTSVHLQQFPDIPATWADDALAAKWDKIRRLRRVITGALEVARAEKKIGASLQAAPVVYAPAELLEAAEGRAMEDICITSDITLTVGDVPEGAFTLPDVPGVGVMVILADGTKCQRCWKVLPDVGSHAHAGVCGRCSDAVDTIGAA